MSSDVPSAARDGEAKGLREIEKLRAARPLDASPAADAQGRPMRAGGLDLDTLLAAVEAANSAIVVSDPTQPDNPLVYINRGFQAVTGYGTECLGRNCRFLQYDRDGRRDDGSLGHPHDGQQKRALDRLRESTCHRFVNVILRNYRKDGTPFWNDLYLTPVFDDAGTCVAIIGVQNDITDRIEATRERNDLARLLSGLFEAAPAVIGVVEEDERGGFRHVSINPAAAQFHGTEREQIVGKTLAELGAPAALVTEWEDAFRNCLEGVRAVRFRSAVPAGIASEPPIGGNGQRPSVGTFDGRRHLRVAVAPVDPRLLDNSDLGDPGEERRAVHRRVCYVADDMSDLTRSEADRLLLEAAVEHAEESVVITTADLEAPGPRVVYVNKAFSEMTGWSANEIVGQSPRVLQGALTDPGVLRRLREALESTRAFRGEAVNYRKDGTPFTLEWSVSPLLDDHGRAAYWISSQRDVTRRRRLEREVLEIQAKEQERIAHDLHDSVAQTLNALSMRADLLKQEFQAEGTPHDRVAELEEMVALARQAAGQARNISHSLLPVDVERSGLMTALQRLAQNTAKLWGIDCSFHYEKPALVSNHDRAVNLFRICQEAVNNAVRHGKARRVRISIGEGAADAGPAARVLSVRDDGIGIADELAFDSASHSERDLDPDSGGVGLHTMRYRAELAGAQLKLEPGLGGGERPGTVVTCSFFADAS